MIKNVAAALGVFLFAVFYLTASGHTYSPDEESLLYVTQAFVTHSAFDIPNPANYPVVGGHRGIGGQIFSGTGLAQSLIALPFYVAGDQIANAFDFHFHAYILRLLTVSVFNSIISALTGVLLYAWLRRLPRMNPGSARWACPTIPGGCGTSRKSPWMALQVQSPPIGGLRQLRGERASPRLALAIVLTWAFATMGWVYARTFYSEPSLTLCFVLAGLSVFKYHETRARHWIFVAGLAAGLGVLTKVQGVLALPALAFYFSALEFKRDPRAFLRANFVPGALFVLALAVGTGLTGYFDFIRFGDPFQTGHGEVSQSFPVLTGLYGLLLSPGKSIFLYAPPLILFFFALPRFVKQHAAEAGFCIIFIATFVVFNARLDFWSGDGAWGPRYLVSMLPFFLLPVVSIGSEWWSRHWRRAFVSALVAVGVFVNILGLTINFDTYIQIQPNADARYFDSAASPLLAQWNLLSARVSDWWNALVVAQNAVVPLRGFLASGDENILPRYLAPRATLLVKSSSDPKRSFSQPLQMSLVVNDYRPANKEKRRLVFYANGSPVPAQLVPTGDSGVLKYEVQLAAARSALIEVITLGSEAKGSSPTGDELGVELQFFQVRAGAQALPVFADLAIPPLPTADPKALWAWFYEPGNAQFDFYWWYLYFSGLPDVQVMVITIIFSLSGIVCLGLGGPQILRVLFPRT